MSKGSKGFYIFYGIMIVIYSLGIGTNAIWTTHEAYYAEAVREMLQSGNWWEFSFNEEPRFQKPPFTYWLMASSSALFGLSEFSLRLPIVLCSLLTILCVYYLGKLLYPERTAFLAALIFSLSLQFIWFKHYASPEIPLTFLFTLSLFFGTKWLSSKRPYWFYLASLCIGLTGLTKGFPYILLFFSVLLVYQLFNRKEEFPPVDTTTVFAGLAIALIIGMSWPVFMIITYGDPYLETFYQETLGRAIDHSSSPGFLESITFYPQVILWSFFPFSALLYYGVYRLFSYKSLIRPNLLPLSWLLVFLLVFTFSSGKLPIYILQAHPAMALLTAYSITQIPFKDRIERTAFKLCLWLPGVLLILSTYFLIDYLPLDKAFYLPLLLVISFLVYQKTRGALPQGEVIALGSLMASTMVVLCLGLFPWIEQYRPYKTIQQVIREKVTDKEIPIFVENRFLDNLPYYAERKVYGGNEWTLKSVLNQPGEKLVLTEKGNPSKNPTGNLLWEGLIHAKGAEDHYFKFIRDCYLLAHGDSSKFTSYRLIHLTK